MQFAVKFADPEETTLQGIAAPFDGPFKADEGPGRDLDGEYFTKSTDFALDWYDDIPLLFHHGHDPFIETDVVGRVKKRQLTDVGMWAEAQLDANSQYFEAIKKLVKKGKLYFSSGANGHLVQTDQKSGEIKRWPMVELSLTPTPSNFLASVNAGKDAMTAAERNRLSDSDFGYIDSDGKGHFPLNDENHVRAAITMFARHDFPDAATKKKTARKIMARARKYGIKVDPESPVAEAAGGDSTNDTEGTNDNDNDSDKSFELQPTGGTGAAAATKAGRVLSKKNEEYIRSIMESLTTFLTELEARYDSAREQTNGT